MKDIPMYHDGSRQLQDQFSTRKLADRLVDVLVRSAFTDEDRAFVESRPLFFLATADAQGRPDCSYKGGRPGFVRVLDPHTLAFPSYDGNGMFKSLGNLLVNAQVGMLFIDFESPKRLRVNGRASAHADDALLSEFAGAQLIVRVRAEAIFPNCPRYIHRMQIVEQSVYVPCEGHTPPVPKWKQFPEFREVLPPGDPAAGPGTAAEMNAAALEQIRIGGYAPGAIGRVTELHGAYYSREWKFGVNFEAKVAAGLAEFLLRFDAARDGFWTANLAGCIEGGVALDGLHADTGSARLRWFILSERIRGRGVGNLLMQEVIGFCRIKGYRRVSLSTIEGLKAARHLYEKFGFRLDEQPQDAQWDLPVPEQRYVLQLEN